MIELAADQAPTWWAPPLFAFAGTVLGAVIALTASWIGTTRQLRRQDQSSRREVYARFIERAVRLRGRFGDISGLISEVNAFEARFEAASARAVTNVVLKPDAMAAAKAEVNALGSELESLKIKVNDGLCAAEEQVEMARLAYYELTLYAGRLLREAGSTVLDALDGLNRAIRARESTGVEKAQKALSDALGDFTALARADVRAPGARSGVRTISKRIERLRAAESGEGSPAAAQDGAF